jgi:hypothetical protein
VDLIKASQTQQQQQGWGNQLDGLLQGLGVDPTKVSALEKQIESAASDARKSATGTDADKQAAVKQAVDKVLQSNGVDPAKFDAAVKARGSKRGGKHRGHHKGGGAGVQPTTNTATNGVTTAASLAQGTLNGSVTAGPQVDVEG